MNEVIYGFVNKDNVLIGTAVIVENDLETLNRIMTEEYNSDAANAYIIDIEKISPQPGQTFYSDGTFYPSKPFNSWIWNTEIQNWTSPIPHPNDGENYAWDENTTSWLLLPPFN